ncbi:hypothetical protein [Dyadobacter sp. CY323]|nr:hypothetical protein [Dyadobacter sp. CY323]
MKRGKSGMYEVWNLGFVLNKKDGVQREQSLLPKQVKKFKHP